MARKKVFAIVHKATDRFRTFERADVESSLYPSYPPAEFFFYDFTGKDEIPKKENASLGDLTIDPATGEWKWSKTDEQFAEERKAERNRRRRLGIVDLKLKADKAQTLGPDFQDIKAEFDVLVAELESAIEP